MLRRIFNLLFKENSPEDLAEKLKILQNKDIRTKLGNFGAEKIKNFYSWDIIVKNRIDVVHSILDYIFITRQNGIKRTKWF